MKIKSIKKTGLFIVLATTMLFACDRREQNIAYPAGITDNVVAIAQKEANLSVFVAAVKRAGLDADLAVLGNYTIFAPTDAAFTAAGITAASVGTMPIDLLRSVLRNHMVSGRILATDLLPGPNAVYTSLQREVLNSSFYNGSSFLNGKKISKVNIFANNGVVHTIDGVLLPPLATLTGTLAANPNLSLLSAALTRTGLATAVNTTTSLLTVFAPTNAAFQAVGYTDAAFIAGLSSADSVILRNVLLYHVIPSSSLTSGVLTSPLNRNGRAFAIDFTNGSTLLTAQGTSVAIGVSGNSVTVKGTTNATPSAVTGGDILYFAGSTTVRPGVLHLIDKVLLP
jgi:uncharacterized surface protein with fasciclin (FAS1) repeats